MLEACACFLIKLSFCLKQGQDGTAGAPGKRGERGDTVRVFIFSDVVSNLLFVCFSAWVDSGEKILLFFPSTPSNFFVLAPTFAQELERKSLLCRLIASFSG